MIHIKLMVYNFDIFDYIDYTSLALYVAEFEINTKCYFLISSLFSIYIKGLGMSNKYMYYIILYFNGLQLS